MHCWDSFSAADQQLWSNLKTLEILGFSSFWNKTYVDAKYTTKHSETSSHLTLIQIFSTIMNVCEMFEEFILSACSWHRKNVSNSKELFFRFQMMCLCVLNHDVLPVSIQQCLVCPLTMCTSSHVCVAINYWPMWHCSGSLLFPLYHSGVLYYCSSGVWGWSWLQTLHTEVSRLINQSLLWKRWNNVEMFVFFLCNDRPGESCGQLS